MKMTSLSLPYGKSTIPCEVPTAQLRAVLRSGIASYIPEKTQEDLIAEAMEHPYGPASIVHREEDPASGRNNERYLAHRTSSSLRLRDLAKGKKNVVILASDHTRPVPSKLLIPQMLREIREGNPDAEITILIATGCHRGTTKEELIRKFGAEILEAEKIVIHDCDNSEMAYLGNLPSGQALYVNRLAKDSDLLVAEGFIEPHFFAGFSGGRKSVLPGIASRSAVIGNHNGTFIADSRARTGILEGNPIHKDMLFAAKAAGLAYIVNVVLNDRHEVVFAAAGDPEAAHAKGCAFLSSLCGVKREEADIVITTNGGYPLDQNAYQAVKGMTAAEACVKEGGVIIMAAKCEDGIGGDSFYRTFKEEKDLAAMTDRFIATPPDKTIVDQWQSQIFARVLQKATVIFISDLPDDVVRDLHMIPASSVEEALSIAESMLPPQPSVTVIPDGVGVIVS